MRKIHNGQLWIDYNQKGLNNVYIKNTWQDDRQRWWVEYTRLNRIEKGHYEKLAGFIHNKQLVKSPFQVNDLVEWKGHICKVLQIGGGKVLAHGLVYDCTRPIKLDRSIGWMNASDLKIVYGAGV